VRNVSLKIERLPTFLLNGMIPLVAGSAFLLLPPAALAEQPPTCLVDSTTGMPYPPGTTNLLIEAAEQNKDTCITEIVEFASWRSFWPAYNERYGCTGCSNCGPKRLQQDKHLAGLEELGDQKEWWVIALCILAVLSPKLAGKKPNFIQSLVS
jgi:hypothetical protein